MSNKPIFVATHPRACSTAFERVFMTRRDTIQCVHEPFGDAYYYGPERLAKRYDNDEIARVESGFSDSTYKTVMDRINRENTELDPQCMDFVVALAKDQCQPKAMKTPASLLLRTSKPLVDVTTEQPRSLRFQVLTHPQGKRLLIKDMAQYFIPPDQEPTAIAPSLLTKKTGVGTVTNGAVGKAGSQFDIQATVDNVGSDSATGKPFLTVTESDNPTVVPSALLQQFQFVFLIRHPINSIPSYYRCCVPPLEDLTSFHGYRRDEAGYSELRALFDYLIRLGCVGPQVAGKRDESDHAMNGAAHNRRRGKPEILVMDADDLLDNPTGIISAFCKSTGIEFSPHMLNWDTKEDHCHAAEAFAKWKGFHEDAINSKDLKPRDHKKQKTELEHYSEWVEKYGKSAAQTIAKSVQENMKDYEYLKGFAICV